MSERVVPRSEVEAAHGWREVGRMIGAWKSTVSLAPHVDERLRCTCRLAPSAPCQNPVTQEDLLCDQCRGGHSLAESSVSS